MGARIADSAPSTRVASGKNHDARSAKRVLRPPINGLYGPGVTRGLLVLVDKFPRRRQDGPMQMTKRLALALPCPRDSGGWGATAAEPQAVDLVS